jgi:hypothetical protein
LTDLLAYAAGKDSREDSLFETRGTVCSQSGLSDQDDQVARLVHKMSMQQWRVVQPPFLAVGWVLHFVIQGAAANAVVTRFVISTDIECAEPSMNTGFGERGRNRTYNLLIFDQQPTNQWFQRFPNHFRGHE